MEHSPAQLIETNWLNQHQDEHRPLTCERRAEFREWLVANRKMIRRMSLRQILSEYGGTISLPAAYRIAVLAGIRGKRRNTTRYHAFWETINWRLPDSTLSAVWMVTRGNIRQRRVRLGARAALYSLNVDRLSPTFRAEMAAEKRRARNFKKPIPR